MKIFLIPFLFFLHTFSLFANSLHKIESEWQSLLDRYVDTRGAVDYVGFDKDYTKLSSWLKLHQNLDVKKFSENEKKALYINLYNASMIYHLLNYARNSKIPVSSAKFAELEINDISIKGSNIWAGDERVNLAGFNLNQDDIEHKLLRGQNPGKFRSLVVKKLDPRLHAAVNCAAISCPRVRKKAYLGKNVDQMLEENIREFISSEKHFRKKGKSLVSNSIVFWYYSDFDEYARKEGKLKGAGDYLAGFIDGKAKDRGWKIKHLKANFNERSKLALKISSDFSFQYQWKVNDKRNYGVASN